MNFLNKWFNYFKGQEDENRDEPIHTSTHSEEDVKRPKQTDQKPVEELEDARMTFYYGYSYHNQENNEGQKEKSHPEKAIEANYQKKTSTLRTKTPSRESTYFQGTFKPTTIPSPVHGIQKNMVSDNSDYNWLLRNTRHAQQSFIERMNEKDDSMSNDQEQTSESVQLSQIVEKQSVVETNRLMLASLKEKHVADTEPENQVEEPTVVPKSEEVVEDNEKQPELEMEPEVVASVVESGPDVETAIKEESEIAVIAEEESVTPEVVEPMEEESTRLEEHKVDESPKEIPRKSTSRSSEKKEIPFNVLMLPTDRRKKQQHSRQEERVDHYDAPPLKLLHYPERTTDDDSAWLDEQATLLEETLLSFHVDAKVVNRTKGPAVTRFEIQPAKGVKVNKITNLTDDIKLSLAAKDIRIEAPIPGKNAIGIEVPNRTSTPVMLREILRRDVFRTPSSPLTAALGLDISGNPVVTDLKKMPHGLVAGATGSGKSVCINSILISLLYKASPEDLKLLLVDPKMVELAPYHDVPHLLAPVITDPKQATASLKWVVQEMERRYELFSKTRVRDIEKYNERHEKLPYILVVIDELADLMMVSPQDVEDAICRIAQKARACGIHLLLATQRPSVDVITGLIKANIPTRIAFSVSSQTDSRTILDMGGAERLLGRGDMLFHENGAAKPVRVQGTFVSDDEIEAVIDYAKKQGSPNYAFESEAIEKAFEQTEQEDELFEDVCYFVVEQGSGSASSIQRRFRVGYNRAARLVDMMEARGVISGAMGSKPRTVLVTEDQLNQTFHSKSDLA
ncbi:DNA translocase FtsK [Shouchella sp. JSM 1781072]|uniref:DNA translocase FtsK n=1 Tax=Bacillaceae TaxID=186817 RepID=UPI0020D097B9|nr:DNA translocase FtsK [Alkalihalobacillus sp. LMS6]UTR05345.1 DNA translocase FtsK [Alkalihalobacillus sp. LMS6]